MRIQEIRAFPIAHRLRLPFAYSQKWVRQRTALLVRITTDEGLVGWGEVFCFDAWPALAALIERTYAPLLVGQDALAPAVAWETLYAWTRDYGQRGLTVAAQSGIDIALWDILGQAAGLPVCRLLGGAFRDRVAAYATGLYLTDEALRDPAPLAREAAQYVAEGFPAVKMKVGFGLDVDVRNVRAVRRAIGVEAGLMIDANHAYDAPTAIGLGRALEGERISWFEEPVVPEDVEGYRQVRQALTIPIAGGEAEFTRYGFRELVSRGAVDIVQPDLCMAGGLSEGIKIAALALAHHVRCVPHVWGTGIALAAALHFIASLPPQPASLHPQQALVEWDRTENPLREDLLTGPIPFEQGCLVVPDRPGLGVTPDPDQLARYAVS